MSVTEHLHGLLIVAAALSLAGCGGGGGTSTLSPTVNNPVPSVTSLSPSTTSASGSAFTLTVNGSSFVPSSVVQWNGSSRTTTFVSSTQLTAAIPASDIAAQGTVQVTVSNPAPGGGVSSPMSLVIGNPVPALTSLSPSSSMVGGLAFTLTVNGSGFISGSVVRWNGSDRTTGFANSTTLQASIPGSDVATAGTAQVNVFNTGPAGGTSNAISFAINNPVPSVISLSPSFVVPGGPAFTLTVAGANFVASSVVQWNGSNRATTIVSGSQLTAAIPASDIVTAGPAQVTVFTPFGGTTSALIVDVGNPVPSIAGVSPAIVPPKGAAFTLVTNGSNFVSSSVVQWNGSSRTTTLVSRTQITAAIPATDIVAAGIAQITVFNPTPAGGTSNPATLTIAPIGVFQRVSVANDGSQASGFPSNPLGSLGDSMSADGRFVGFESDASNLVPGDTNNANDVFVRDTCMGAPAGCTPSTTRVSVASDGTQGNGGSFGFPIGTAISTDGRLVAFTSSANNLVLADTNGSEDVFVRDTCFGAPSGCMTSTTRVSVASDGSQLSYGDGGSLSPDGRFVTFESQGAGCFDCSDSFVRDTCFRAPAGCTPSTTRMSTANNLDRSWNGFGSISADGRFVAFGTAFSTLTEAIPDSAYVRDTCAGVPVGCTPSTLFVSTANDVWVRYAMNPNIFGAPAPSISADGRYVAFSSYNPLSAFLRVFVRDTCIGAAPGCTPSTIPVSVANDGTQANARSTDPSSSADGRFIAFDSTASNLDASKTNGVSDIFVRDTCLGAPAGCTPTTVRISIAGDGTQGNGASRKPLISADGRLVTFTSDATNLVPGDTNNVADVFLAWTGFDPVSPIPSLTFLTPSNATAGTAGFTLTLTGSNFVPGSVVGWNGSNHTTFYLSRTKLAAVILASDIASTGTAPVTVFNPAPGGGTSNALTFTINP